MGRWKEGIGGPVSTMGELPVVAVGALKTDSSLVGLGGCLFPILHLKGKLGLSVGDSHFVERHPPSLHV